MEVNIWGQGVRGDQEVVLRGEAKSQLKKKDVDGFLKTLRDIQGRTGKTIVPIIVTYPCSPPVRAYVRENGIFLYFSYPLRHETA